MNNMDQNLQNQFIASLISPYQEKIKKLEEEIGQKDLEIAQLKFQLFQIKGNNNMHQINYQINTMSDQINQMDDRMDSFNDDSFLYLRMITEDTKQCFIQCKYDDNIERIINNFCHKTNI